MCKSLKKLWAYLCETGSDRATTALLGFWNVKSSRLMNPSAVLHVMLKSLEVFAKSEFPIWFTALKQNIAQDIRDHNQHIVSLFAKITEMEVRCRHSNLRLMGLPESEDGSDLIWFLETCLPMWILSLAGCEIKIERAHHLYSRREIEPSRSCTLIFKLLDYADRQAILRDERKAYPVRYKERILSFFPDFSNEMAKKWMEFNQIRKKLIILGLKPFLIYPAELKLTQSVNFKSPQEAEKFLDSNETLAAPLKK